jgi:hypothetical protein
MMGDWKVLAPILYFSFLAILSGFIFVYNWYPDDDPHNSFAIGTNAGFWSLYFWRSILKWSKGK